MKNTIIKLMSLLSVILLSQAQSQNIITLGVNPNTDYTNFNAHGLDTLNGSLVAFNAGVNGSYNGTSGNDLNYVGGGLDAQTSQPQPNFPYASSPQYINYQSAGDNTTPFGFRYNSGDGAGGFSLSIGTTLRTDLGSHNTLVVSEVAAFAGKYSLNGTSIALQAGQVGYWDISSASLTSGQTLLFTSDASVPVFGTNVYSGVIGFSATDYVAPIPEPSTWVMMTFGLALMAVFAMQKRFVWFSCKNV